MATPKFRAQVRLERDGGLPKDACINVFHFEGDTDSPVSDRDRWDILAPGLASRLVTFYQAIGTKLSVVLSGDASVTLYDMDDPKPRIPRLVEDFQFPTGPEGLPSEVAVCLSMVAEPSAGAIKGRQRGRVYLGPLDRVWSFQAAGGPSDMRPELTYRQQVLAAAVTMATGVNGAARLAIYSPTTDPIPPFTDDAFTDVRTLYIDDAFDTQRRRGAAASSRASVLIAP